MAFCAKDALVVVAPDTYDAVIAYDAVPCSDPVNPSVDMVDPVMVNPLRNSREPVK
jgi:hypothetical protein